jgi:hypothetical protein
MRRLTASTIAVVLLASAAGALAQPPSSTQVLQDGLQAIVVSTVSQSAEVFAQAQGTDHDQGDDHASGVAILKVCNHDNPSAERSAICPKPNSPP